MDAHPQVSRHETGTQTQKSLRRFVCSSSRHPGSGRDDDKNIFLFRLILVFSPAAAVWARPWSNFPEFASNEGNDHDDVYLVI